MTRQSTGIILTLCLIALLSINLFNPPVTLNPSYPRPQSVPTDYVRVAAILRKASDDMVLRFETVSSVPFCGISVILVKLGARQRRLLRK